MISGSYFGEIEIIDHIPREFSAIAECDIKLFKIDRNNFIKTLNKHPRILDNVIATADIRRFRNMQAKQEVIDLLEQIEVKKSVDIKDLIGK